MLHFLSFYPHQDPISRDSFLKNLLLCPTISEGPDVLGESRGSCHCSNRALTNTDPTTLVSKSRVESNSLDFTHPPTHFQRGRGRPGLGVGASQDQRNTSSLCLTPDLRRLTRELALARPSQVSASLGRSPKIVPGAFSPCWLPLSPTLCLHGICDNPCSLKNLLECICVSLVVAECCIIISQFIRLLNRQMPFFPISFSG